MNTTTSPPKALQSSTFAVTSSNARVMVIVSTTSSRREVLSHTATPRMGAWVYADVECAVYTLSIHFFHVFSAFRLRL